MSSPATLGVVETDAPCEQCGFNLHGQRIWRDERLELPIARCPECGRHHAVGKSTSAATPWLGRLALLGLLIWLVIGLAFVASAFGLCLGLQAGAADIALQRSFETVDGRRAYMTFEHTSRESPGPKWALAEHRSWNVHETPEAERLVPADQIVFRVRPSHVFSPPPGVGLAEYARSEFVWTLALCVLGAALGVAIVGVVAASAFWYWRRWRRAAWLAVPIVAALIMAAIEWSNLGNSSGTRVGRNSGIPMLGTRLIVANVAIVCALQIVCIGVGLWLGRPIVRLLLTVFIPPRARQAFTFLWHCDGKTMPQPYVRPSTR